MRVTPPTPLDSQLPYVVQGHLLSLETLDQLAVGSVLNRVRLVNKSDLLHQLGHALADICQVIALVGAPS